MSNFPCISDMIEAIEQLDVPRGSDRAKAKAKVLDRLNSLRDLLPGLDVQESRDLCKLLGQYSVILDATDLSDIALPVLFSFMTTLFREIFRADEQPGITRMEVIEEAHRCLGGEVAKRTSDLKKDNASGILRDLRKSGTCGVVISQLIMDLADSVLGNLGTVISLRQGHGKCISQAAASLNLLPWQKPEIGKLPNRHAITRFSRFGEPVHMVIKDAGQLLSGSRPVSREEARERSRAILDSIPFVLRPEPEGEQGSGTQGGDSSGALPSPKPKHVCAACRSLGLSLSRIQHKVMEAICEKPDEEIRDRCERLRITRGVESIARRALGNIFGLIAYIGSLGNRRLFFSPTTGSGERWREAHGLPRWSEHGGPIHAFMITKSEQKFTIACPGIKFTRRRTGEPSGVRPDSLGVTPGPECWRVALQVTVANRPKVESLSLLKLCCVRKCSRNQGPPAGIDLVVSVAVNKQVQKSIERAVRELNNGKIPSNLVLFNAEDHLLDPSFDWSILMEREI